MARTKDPLRDKREATRQRLLILKNLDLHTKTLWALERIRQWHEYQNGRVYVSFSGGKDSTVLLHLVRQAYPNTPAVFFNTGLEYPEIVDFIRSFPDVTEIRPKMSFLQVVQKYGYPIYTKKTAGAGSSIQNPTQKNENTRRLHKTGIDKNGKKVRDYGMRKGWYEKFETAPFKISSTCCDKLKKEPAIAWEKTSGKVPFIGTMVSDSSSRMEAYLNNGGCNSFAGAHQYSAPLSIWTEQDILQFIFENKLPISSVYGEVVKGKAGKFYTTGVQRTGCIFCMFGIHRELKKENRFQKLYKTHPKLWKYCMDVVGLRKVLEHFEIKAEPDGFGL